MVNQEATPTLTVTVSRKEVVTAAPSHPPLEDNEHTILPLSNLDLLLPPLDASSFFCYAKPAARSFADVVGVLKVALGRALLTYYPLAGEVVANSAGEPEILCNNRGVDFAEARADVLLRDLRLHDPDHCLNGKLIPKIRPNGNLSVQVTEFQCGGIMVAFTINHQISDLTSANMFMVSWAEIAAGWRPLSLTPTFDRSLLTPRQTHHHIEYSSIDDLYVPMSAIIPPTGTPPSVAEHPVNRIYYIASDDMKRLQSLASPGLAKSTKLEAFSAYLWKAIAGGSSARHHNHHHKAREYSLGVAVDGRRRLARASAPMASYFGNVVSIPYATLGPAELGGMELWEAAAAVHEAIKAAATEEHFLGLVDWVEARRPERALAKVYCGADGEERVAVVVSSGQGFPVSEMDFGWGKPVFGSNYLPWGGSAGYVMPMPSVKGNGDWVVYVHLKKRFLDALEDGMGDLLQPMSSDYIGLF